MLKITISEHISFTISPSLQAQILRLVTTNVSIYIGHAYSILVNPNNVELIYDDNKVNIKCASQWVQVMYLLNNMSSKIKESLTQQLEKYWCKLSLMIEVAMSIQNNDVMCIILGMLFEKLQHEYTYDVHTYVNDNNGLKSILCFSKLYGHEYNPHNISNMLIKYLDKAIHLCNNAEEFINEDHIVEKVIDSEQKMNLIVVSKQNRMMSVIKLDKSEVLLFVYIIDRSIETLDDNREYIQSQMKSIYESYVFHKFIEKELGFNQVNVRTHHNLIDDKLC